MQIFTSVLQWEAWQQMNREIPAEKLVFKLLTLDLQLRHLHMCGNKKFWIHLEWVVMKIFFFLFFFLPIIAKKLEKTKTHSNPIYKCYLWHISCWYC